MKIRVWVALDLLVIKEALAQVLCNFECIELVDEHSEAVDVGVFRLASTNQLQDFFLRGSLPQAKLIVVSLSGNQAYVRLPRQKNWSDVRPFGIRQLIAEVCAGRDGWARAPT